MPILQEPSDLITINDTPPLLTRRIVLIGFMGAGKSTIGRLLASQLGWQFIDTDTEIEMRHGRSIAEMFEEEGENAFRRRESAAIARALGMDHAVIAVGGGAPEILTNRLLLEQTQGTVVVYLNASFEVMFDRCVLQEGAAVRPVLLEAATVAERFQSRLPFYRRYAHHCVETGEQEPLETAERVLTMIGARQQSSLNR